MDRDGKFDITLSRAQYSAIDKDGDGMISQQELKAHMEQSSQSSREPTEVKVDDDQQDVKPADALPDGWSKEKDSDGRTYYYHRATKKSQWVRPTAEDEDPPPQDSDEGEGLQI